jgi:hypothetical protein
MEDKLSAFKKQNYINLETFRKNGTGVKTPVWFMQSGNLLYVRTGEDSAKVKRIRRNPIVKIAPCTGNGKVLGGWIEATAEITRDAEIIKEAEQLAKQKYGLMKKAFELMTLFNRSVYTTLIIRLN